MRMLRIVITSPRTWLATIGDFYDEEDGSTEEPEWVADEKDNFNNVLDKDGDGRLDNAEVGQWVLPRDLEYVADEAKHLLSSADENQVRSQCVLAAGCSFYVDPDGCLYFFRTRAAALFLHRLDRTALNIIRGFVSVGQHWRRHWNNWRTAAVIANRARAVSTNQISFYIFKGKCTATGYLYIDAGAEIEYSGDACCGHY